MCQSPTTPTYGPTLRRTLTLWPRKVFLSEAAENLLGRRNVVREKLQRAYFFSDVRFHEAFETLTFGET